jgi:DNA-binding IclR family transcriptional regulator
MLMHLLALISRGGIQQPSELAAELGVPLSLLEAMLADLGRMGYLRSMADACRHCSAGCALAVAAGSPAWTLTAKGRRMVGR